MYNANRIEEFRKAYVSGLIEAINRKPSNYAIRPDETPESFAELTCAKMAKHVTENGIYSINSPSSSCGLKNACKVLGINPTFRALETFLNS